MTTRNDGKPEIKTKEDTTPPPARITISPRRWTSGSSRPRLVDIGLAPIATRGSRR